MAEVSSRSSLRHVKKDAWLSGVPLPQPSRLLVRPLRSIKAPIRTALSRLPPALLGLLLIGYICGTVASAENDSEVDCLTQTPSCETKAAADAASYRCECDSSCRYFGSCCTNDEHWPTGNMSSGRVNDVGDGSRGGIGPDGRLHSDLYECVAQTYGTSPVYVVSRCPPEISLKHYVLATQCNNSDDASLALDARFWPVSSTVTRLIYRSMYCALCYGETDSTIIRWSAYLNCTLGTNTSNAEELLTRCWVSSYKPPTGAPPAPKCLKELVDRCELNDPATVPSSASAVKVPVTLPSDDETNSAISTVANQESTPVSLKQKPSPIEDGAEYCLDGTQSVVWYDKVPYRNYYCAKCSGIPSAKLACTRRPDISPQSPSMSMQVLLDPAGPVCRGCALYSSSTGQPKQQQQQQQRACRGGEFYDWLLQSCRSFCPPGMQSGPEGTCASSPTSNIDATTMLAFQLQQKTIVPLLNDTEVPRSPFKVATTNAFAFELFDTNLCIWKAYDDVLALLSGNNVSRSGVAVGNASLTGEPDVTPSGEVLYVEVYFNRSSYSLPKTWTNANTSTDKITFCAYCRWQTPDDTNISTENDTLGIYWKHHWYRRPVFRRSGQSVVLCVDASSAAEDVISNAESGLSRCSPALDTVATVLLGISVFCLTVHAVAFIFISSLRNIPGRVVFSQVLALLFAYVFYLSRAAVDEKAAVACYALSVTVHFFLLSYFAWTLVLAVEIHSAVQALKRIYSGSRRFMIYSLVGWLLPLAVVIATLLTDLFGPELLRPVYGLPQCWMSGTYGHLTFFIAPVCAAVFVDIVLYVIVIVRVTIIARQTARVRSSHKEKVILCAKLLLALGVLWIFAVAGALSGNDVILCVFSNVLNTSQGLFIFLIFFCADKGVQGLVKQCLRPGSRGVTMTSTISRISIANSESSLRSSIAM